MTVDLTRDHSTLILSPDVIDEYRLTEWANEFSLMTAGYRDRLDPGNPNSSQVAFNTVTLAILAEAKARVFAEKRREGGAADIHVGGEVRPNTPAFVNVISRVYASHGQRVHLRKELATTPIWYSSFGVFYEEFESGENLTASHSPYFKGGWKPLDSEGKQLTTEEPRLIEVVRELVRSRATIPLVDRNDPHIVSDFDVDHAYASYQRQVFGAHLFEHIRSARERGFKCRVTPLGGSMGATTRRLFHLLNVPVGTDGVIQYFLDEENERFHGVGEIDGHNYGADPSKKEICRNLGAADMLSGKQANAVFVWDPDGDRFNIITLAPAEWAERARQLGVDVEFLPDRSGAIVYFSPNQLYLLLIAHRIALLKASGDIDRMNWFVGISYPTSCALEEFLTAESIPVVRVPTGFKHMGDLCNHLERQAGRPASFESVTGQRTEIGVAPRVLFLCEESGGATMGAGTLMASKGGTRQMLCLREKDGFQVALLTLGLAADLHTRNVSFAQAYCDILERSPITHKFADRKDVLLYDEALIGDALRQAKAAGIVRRDRVVAFFRGLAERYAASASADAIDAEVRRHAPPDSRLPKIRSVAWIGDGTMIEMENARLIVRASGTDALLRYYIDATDNQLLEDIAALVVHLPT